MRREVYDGDGKTREERETVFRAPRAEQRNRTKGAGIQ